MTAMSARSNRTFLMYILSSKQACERAGAPFGLAERGVRDAHCVQDRNEQIVVRDVALEREVAARGERAAGAAGEHVRRVLPAVGVAGAELVRPQQKAAVEQSALAFADGFELLDQRREPSGVPLVDARQLVARDRVAVGRMGEAVVPFFD